MNPALLRAGGRIATAGALVALLAANAISNAPQPPDGPEAKQLLGGLPLSFVENRGQWDTPARFVAKRGPMVARLEQDALVVELRDGSDPENPQALVLRLAFEGASEDVWLEGEGQQPGVRNYFLGNDPEAWRTGVPGYDSVLYRGLQDGIDLRVRDHDGRLEYDLLLAPGADLSRFAVRCEGVEGISVDPDGSLVLETALGPVRQTPPATWYVLDSGDRQSVDCRFVVHDEFCYGFEIPDRDPVLPLVIDPGLEWSTYLGGSNYDVLHGIAVDATGTVIVGGRTGSMDFPTTPGGYQPVWNGSLDGVLAGLDPSASGSAQLVWATFLGGSAADRIRDIVLEASGTICVVGNTSSADFPVTPNAYDPTPNGGMDGFVARLDATGSELLYGTFHGGILSESCLAVESYGLDTVAICGWTSSEDFPVTMGAYQATLAGATDAFMSVLSLADGLVYSTYLGGSLADGNGAPDLIVWMDLSVAADGQVVLTGVTASDDFPTVNPHTTTPVGSTDLFVSRLDPDLDGVAGLTYSTYLGGTDRDQPLEVLVEPSGLIDVSGGTFSDDFPVTAGALSGSFGGLVDAFWFRLDPSQSGVRQLLYSTYIGGVSVDNLAAFALDPSGDVIGVGWTGFENFGLTDIETTCQAYDQTPNGASDGFVIRFHPSTLGSELVYSSLVGGPGEDGFLAMAAVSLGPEAEVAAAGISPMAGFPTTPGAFQPDYHGGSGDGIVVTFELTPQVAHYCETAPNSVGPGATIDAGCSVSLAENDFELLAAGAIPGQFGLFYYGPEQQQVPFGDGFQCVAPGAAGLFRLNPPLVIDGSGAASRPVDFRQPPADAGPGQITAGSTWNFQFWYRDPAGPGGTTFNLSDALSVTFTP